MGPPAPGSNLMGPPAPAQSPQPIRQHVAGSRSASAAPRRGGLPGRIGPAGPIQGPLNTTLNVIGPVQGPSWEGKPLPGVDQVAPPGSVAAKGNTPKASARMAANSSEIPDARTLALSRLANPVPQVRTVEAAPAAQVAADRPLGLRLSAGRPGRTAQVGEMVPVHVSATAPCYAAVIRVDASGNASTVWQSSSPSRSFSLALRAGPTAGHEYLLAVASIHPLNGREVAGALRASGAGFTTVGDGGTAPGTAWSLAVGQAGGIGGGGKGGWQRFEWDVATRAFAVAAPPAVAKVAPKAVAKSPALPKKTAAATGPKLAPGKPATGTAPTEGSQLPAGVPQPPKDPGGEPKPEVKPAAPNPEPMPEAKPAAPPAAPASPDGKGADMAPAPNSNDEAPAE